MVTINQKEGNKGMKGEFRPTMWRHKLTVQKDSGPFIKGETVECYIAEYSDNRFAVWDSSFLHHNKYKVFSENDLHDTFNES